MNKLIPIAILFVMAAMLFVSWSNISSYNENLSEEYNRHIEMAEIYMSKEIYIDAVSEYEAALKLDRNNYELAMKIVDLYDSLGIVKSYVTACENAIAADESQIEPYLKLADYYLSVSNYEKANKILKQAEDAIGGNSEITERIIKIKGIYSTTSLKYSELGIFHYEEGKSTGYAVVSYEGLYGLINSSQKQVLACEYEDVGPLANGLIPVKKNGEYYYLDEDGYRKLVPDETADYFGVFGNGYAPAAFNGIYGYIDDNLEMYNFEYTYAGCFSNGIAAVEKDGKWAVIDTYFNNVTEFEFDEILLDDYGFCSTYGVFFAKKGDSYYLYDKEGTLLTDAFEDAKIFASDEPAAIKQNGKWGFVSKEGEIVISPAYEDANSFSIGYAPFLEDGLWGCIDEKGIVLIEPTFDKIESFSQNGYSVIEMDGVKKYIVVNLYE